MDFYAINKINIIIRLIVRCDNHNPGSILYQGPCKVVGAQRPTLLWSIKILVKKQNFHGCKERKTIPLGGELIVPALKIIFTDYILLLLKRCSPQIKKSLHVLQAIS